MRVPRLPRLRPVPGAGRRGRRLRQPRQTRVRAQSLHAGGRARLQPARTGAPRREGRGRGCPRQGHADRVHPRCGLSVSHGGAAGDDDLVGRSGAGLLDQHPRHLQRAGSGAPRQHPGGGVLQRARVWSGSHQRVAARRSDALQPRADGDRRRRAHAARRGDAVACVEAQQRNLRPVVHRHVQAPRRLLPSDRHLRAKSVRWRGSRLGRELRHPSDARLADHDLRHRQTDARHPVRQRRRGGLRGVLPEAGRRPLQSRRRSVRHHLAAGEHRRHRVAPWPRGIRGRPPSRATRAPSRRAGRSAWGSQPARKAHKGRRRGCA